MATERQAPDAVLASSNLSGGLSDIDEDPDSPDGNWMVASGNNTNVDVRTSFPTPTGNPTVGADLQEFRAWVRQYDEGQGGTPEVRIELWEDGNLIRAGSDEDVLDGGKLISFTWNASELGTADGSLVECKVVGTKSGGSPSNRNAVDVGAVEWNVAYDAGAIQELAGISSGVAITSGAIKINKKLAGISEGLCQVTGLAKVIRGLTGISVGVASVTGTIRRTKAMSGLSAGLASVSGGIKLTKGLAGITEGRASLAGSLAVVVVKIKGWWSK